MTWRRRDERGVALILTAIFMSTLFIASSFAIDLGGRGQQKRNDHLIADMAALDGLHFGDVATPGQTTSVRDQAVASANRNHFFDKSADVLAVTRGQWADDGSGTYAFTPEAGYWSVSGSGASTWITNQGHTINCPCNALQVKASSPYQDLFQARNAQVTLSASAIAVNCIAPCNPLITQGKGQFRIGSTLVSVSTSQSTILNNLLSPFGITSNLDAVGYQGLVNSNTTLGAFGTALGLSAATPDQILNSSVKLSDVLAAEMSLLGTGSAGACGSASAACSSYELSVLRTMVLASSLNSTATVKVGQLLGVATGSGSALTTSVNLFDALEGTIDVADGTAVISIPSLTINAGIATVTASVKAITPPQLSKFDVAPQSATNTQVSVTLNVSMQVGVSLLGIGYLVNVNLPVSVTAGAATATMTAVNCPTLPATKPTSLTIGAISFNSASASIAGTASVAVLGTLNLTGSQPVVISADSTAPHTLNYTKNFKLDPSPTTVSVGTASSLPTSIPLTVSGSGALGLLGSVVNLAMPTISSTLTTALGQVNSLVLPTLLSTLGATIGKADLLGWQATCPTPTLVGG